MKEVQKLLNKIQQELNAPKGQRNDFAQFNYRSCEDILTAVKPLLGDGYVLLNDTIEVHNNCVYIKATASLVLADESIECSALAKEPPQAKPKMDESQTTGSTSSYARKYSLNGLFCIDDTKDADTNESHVMNNSQPKNYPSNNDEKEWFNMLNKDGTPDDMKWSKVLNMHNKGITSDDIISKIRETKNINKKEMDYIRGNL